MRKGKRPEDTGLEPEDGELECLPMSYDNTVGSGEPLKVSKGLEATSKKNWDRFHRTITKAKDSKSSI